MRNKANKILVKTGAAFFAAACLFALFLPHPRKIADGESYECVWSNGSVSRESFSSAYQSLAGIDQENVLLTRGGLTGRIESEAGDIVSTLESGDLGELLNCRASGTRIDRAALYCTFSKRVWYSGEYYVWTGSNIERASRATAEEIVFLEGSVSSRVLSETNASTVHLRADVTLKADVFAGSNVTTVRTQAPYLESGGAIYMDTAGGKRLVAALAGVEELVVDGDTAFIDKGALIACQNLKTLTLPFLGSAKSPEGTAYTGELAHLFAHGKEYRVPETLTSVTVTGGRVTATAFYACPNLKQIKLCHVYPSEISADAFLGLDALEVLHTPNKNVVLTGDFTAYSTLSAACGCAVFIKNHSQK